MTAASVAGPQCSLEVVASCADLSDPLGALDEALGSGLVTLVQAPGKERLGFTHPLVRAAVYGDLPPTRRRSLNLAFASATSGPASIPHRVAAAWGPDDDLAAELEALADSEVAAGVLPQAAEHLLWASRVAGKAKGELLLLRAVEVMLISGDPAGAIRLHDAVEACGGGPFKSYVMGCLIATTGTPQEGEARFRMVLDSLGPPGSGDLSNQAASALALMLSNLGRDDEAIDWARRVLDTQSQSPLAKFVATWALARSLVLSGRGQEGLAVLDDLSPSRAAPKPFEAELMATRGSLKSWIGDCQGAVRDLSAVVRWARGGNWISSIALAYAALADAEYQRGEWDGGLAHAEVAVSLAEGSRTWELPYVHAVAGCLHAGRGNWTDAARHVAASYQASQVIPQPASTSVECLAAATFARAHGDWEGVLAAHARMTRRWPTPPAGDLTVNRLRLLRVEALLSLGQIEEAKLALGELTIAITQYGGAAAVDICRLNGGVASAEGRTARARASFEEGIRIAKTAEAPLSRALLGLAYGRFLRASGNRRSAIRELRAALELFRRLDARPWFDACDCQLSACGIRGSVPGPAPSYELTAPERVVAHLVASGMSNREVADELYLSTKAIEYQLSQVFAKRGIRSRWELGAHLSPGKDTSADLDRVDEGHVAAVSPGRLRKPAPKN